MAKRELWSWNRTQTAPEVAVLLENLQEIYPLTETPQPGRELRFEKITGEGLISEVVRDGQGALIRYNATCTAGRGVGAVLAGFSGRESTPFTMMGIMLDVSRNQVFTLPALKKIFQRLAFLGYNAVFLYSEETYELPGEPYFGLARGRYTAEEIREADDMAAALGIELIGCIQTLGHLDQMLRWQEEYANVRDTAGVLMVGAERTKTLIGKMLDFWSENLRSRRIHVGMDETHDLGRGRYLDTKGYTKAFTLFQEQLAMVNDGCLKRGLEPMIWSDMYFRLSNKDLAYYDLESEIPKDVVAKIPSNVKLVYWDYYNTDQDFYEKFIERHRNIGFDPMLGAGLWIWSRPWYDHQKSRAANRAAIAASRAKKLKEIFFTMWGDDGALCHFPSVLTGLVDAANLMFGIDDEKVTKAWFEAMTESSYEANLAPTFLTVKNLSEDKLDAKVVSSMIALWDDPLLGLGWHSLRCVAPDAPESVLAEFRKVLKTVEAHRTEKGGADLDYAWHLTNVSIKKYELREKLLKAYATCDCASLAEVRDKIVPETVAAWDDFTKAYRRQWLAISKPFGLETMQHRMGGIRARLLETADRIDDLLNRRIENIPELELQFGSHVERTYLYRDMASGSIYV